MTVSHAGSGRATLVTMGKVLLWTVAAGLLGACAASASGGGGGAGGGVANDAGGQSGTGGGGIGGTGGALINEAGLDAPPSDAPFNPDAACATVTEKATPELLPVDIIWVVDNSVSMQPAIDEVTKGLNAFANLIAGNLSFHQAAIHAGERSTELAITNWLEPNNSLGDPDLHDNSAGNGYRAMREDPPGTDSWDKFWTDTLAAQAVAGTPDAAGNTVSYVIHRLCDGVGAPHVVNCAKSPAGSAGGSQSAGGLGGLTNNQVYYRITTRIAGPRNTVAYIQTIIAL